MDRFRIDSHKLIYHVGRLNDWLNGKVVYPVYMELSPSGICNHRCTFCGLDFMGYQKRFLDADILGKRLAEMGVLGVRAIMYGGEGEPFKHKDFGRIVEDTYNSKIDSAITSNGVLMDRGFVDNCLKYVSWIKFSVSAATPKTYAAIHRCKPDDLKLALDNIAYAVEVRNGRRLDCALGVQLLLLPENKDEVVMLARTCRDIGVDYLVVKPYSQHTMSKTDRYKDIRYGDYKFLGEELAEINTDKFNVVFRSSAMEVWDVAGHGYEKCYSFPFWSYIDSGGNVWGCSVYLGDERFLYGNINEKTFKEIWEGEARRRSLNFTDNDLDVRTCRVNCRMDKINRFLWELKNPPEHVNFI